MTQLEECLPNTHKALHSVSRTAHDLLVHVCNLNVREVEAGGSEAQDHLEHIASLKSVWDMRSCLKNKQIRHGST